MSKKSKYSDKLSEPNSELADVFKLCYAPRSSRRRNRPIYALDPYSKNIVVFQEPTVNDKAESSCHVDVDVDEINIDLSINNNIQVEEKVHVERKDVIVERVDLLLSNYKSTDPVGFKEIMQDPVFAANFYNDQYLPAIENYKRFIDDPDGSGIENLNEGKFEDFQQEDGSIVSMPIDPHPVIFPFHIKKRQNELLIGIKKMEELKVQSQEVEDFNQNMKEYVRRNDILTEMYRIRKPKENGDS